MAQDLIKNSSHDPLVVEGLFELFGEFVILNFAIFTQCTNTTITHKNFHHTLSTYLDGFLLRYSLLLAEQE